MFSTAVHILLRLSQISYCVMSSYDGFPHMKHSGFTLGVKGKARDKGLTVGGTKVQLMMQLAEARLLEASLYLSQEYIL